VTIVLEVLLALIGIIGGTLCLAVSVFFCKATCRARYAVAGPAGVSLLLIYRGDVAKRQPAGMWVYSEAENQHFRPAGATRCADSNCQSSYM